MLKLWISGANGQLGLAINAAVNPLDFEIFNTDQTELDITDIKTVINFAEVNRPDIIINCVGITDVFQCEKDPVQAYRVNGLGARNLSIAATKISAKLLQISTDDVFDGIKCTQYSEFDTPNPKTVYGKSKLAGEIFVKEFTHKHFIVRSTWVYGTGFNFVNDFLKKIEKNEIIAIESDQYGSPTSAKELAKFILFLIRTNEYGTYHATCSGICSRYEFAKEMIRITNAQAQIKAVKTAGSEFGEIRPSYAVLENFMLGIQNIYRFPDWKKSLAEYFKEYNVDEQKVKYKRE